MTAPNFFSHLHKLGGLLVAVRVTWQFKDSWGLVFELFVLEQIDNLLIRRPQQNENFELGCPGSFLAVQYNFTSEGLCQRLEDRSMRRLLKAYGREMSFRISLCCSALVSPAKGRVQISWSTWISAVNSDVWFGAMRLYTCRSNSYCLGGRHRVLMIFVACYPAKWGYNKYFYTEV